MRVLLIRSLNHSRKPFPGMNTIDNDCCAVSGTWTDRMRQNCQEVLQHLTAVVLRLRQDEYLADDESTSLSLYVESCD